MHSQCAFIHLPLNYRQQTDSEGWRHNYANVSPASLATANKETSVLKFFPSVLVRHIGHEKFTPDKVLLGVAGVLGVEFFTLNLLVKQEFKLPKSYHQKNR
jgi:hypothetical protein